MPVPSKMADLFTLPASNSPAGSDAIGNSLDDYMRAIQAIVRSTNAISSATIASGSTTDLGSSDGEAVTVTGTTTITSFGTAPAGIVREVTFTGILVITNSAAIVLGGGAGGNYTTAAGDILTFRSLGSGNWKQITSNPFGYVAVNKAGDSMTGSLSVTGSISATAGVTGATAVTSTAGTFTGAPTVLVLQCAAASGLVSIRPNGGSTTGQTSIASSGDMTVGGNINIPNGGAMRATGAFCIVAAGGGGFVTIRPKGSTDSSVAFNVNASGSADFTGVISAADFTYTSDVRLKKNIKYAEPRDLSGIPVATWDWRQKGKGSGRGVIAQTVQRFAADLVSEDDNGNLVVDKVNMLLERVAYLETKLKKAGLW